MTGYRRCPARSCGVLREAEGEEIVIRRRAKPAGIAGCDIHKDVRVVQARQFPFSASVTTNEEIIGNVTRCRTWNPRIR
jgi:hypothetical protein